MGVLRGGSEGDSRGGRPGAGVVLVRGGGRGGRAGEVFVRGGRPGDMLDDILGVGGFATFGRSPASLSVVLALLNMGGLLIVCCRCWTPGLWPGGGGGGFFFAVACS